MIEQLVSAGLTGSAYAANSLISYGLNKRMAEHNAYLQHKYSRELMAYQYQLGLRGLQEGPSSAKAGLLAAGYNPMLAISSAMQAPAVGAGSAGMPSATGEYGVGDLGEAFDRASNSATSRKKLKEEAKRVEKLQDAELEKLEADANQAMANSGAVMYDAETRRMEAEARIKSLDAGTNKTNVNIGTDIIDSAAPIAVAAASAYGVKKSTDLAREALKKGLTKQSAKHLAKEVTGKSPRVISAASGASASGASAFSKFGKFGSALRKFGLLAAPLMLGYGIKEGAKGRKTDVWRKNEKYHIRSLHGWH